MADMVTLTGTWLDAAGTPMTGSVLFSLSEPASDGSSVYAGAEVRATLNGAGAVTVELEATDDLTVTGNSYRVQERLNGVPPRTYWIELPASADPANIADLTAWSRPPFVIADPTRAVSLSGFNAHAADTGYHSADLIVDAAGGGHYTTLVSAIAAATAGQRIRVVSDLTITAPVTIDKQLTIEWAENVTLYNDTASSDAIRSSKYGSTAGSVSNVRLLNLKVTRGPSVTGASRCGKAINFKGALLWEVHSPEISYHDKGLWFDATPYPTGYCFFNRVFTPRIQNCTTGIEATSTIPNANTIYSASLYNCDHPLIHNGGMEFSLMNLSIENTSALDTTDSMIETNAQNLRIEGLYCEAGPSDPAIDVQAGALGTHIVGWVTNRGGGTVSTVDDSVGRITLELAGQKPLMLRRAGTAADFSRTHSGAIVDEIATFNSRDNGETADVMRFAPISDGTIFMKALTAAPSDIAYARTDGQWHIRKFANSGVIIPHVYKSSTSSWKRLAIDDDCFSHVVFPDITATTLKSFVYNRNLPTYTEVWIVPQASISYSAGVSYWTVTIEEWQGINKIADAWTWTQSAALADNERIGTASLAYTLAAPGGPRYLRVRFTKTGTPGNWVSPLVIIRNDWT